MAEPLTCDTIREAVHGYVSDCCPVCHSGRPDDEAMVLHKVRKLTDGRTAKVCCRVWSNLVHHGLIEGPKE